MNTPTPTIDRNELLDLLTGTDGLRVMLVAPSLLQSRNMLAELEDAARAYAPNDESIIGEVRRAAGRERLTLTNGSIVTTSSLRTPYFSRGYVLDLVAVREGVELADEHLVELLPSLVTTGGRIVGVEL